MTAVRTGTRALHWASPLINALACAAMIAGTGMACAQPAATRLDVMLYTGVQNLPLFAAQAQGYFARRGLAVQTHVAPNSQELRDGLAAGRYQIVHTAVDNAVALAELAKVDIVVVMGGDNGFNHLFVQQDVRSLADLRGRTVIVDAPDTAFAIMLYKALALNGLKRGDYAAKPLGATRFRLEAMQKETSAAAAMLNLPFSIHARRAGLKDMGVAVDMIGPYLGTAGFALRNWSAANADALTRYIQAYAEGLRWALAPANRDAAIAMLVAELKLPADIARESYDIVAHPVTGFARDAKVDMEGFRNVLKLRAEVEGQWGGNPPPPERYLDLSYYERAMKGL
jgi:ABC-type nitrate/sulfonate/bicarbonate transport system substrate-binding protein